jgi:non-ribosomal peptide synthetase component F
LAGSNINWKDLSELTIDGEISKQSIKYFSNIALKHSTGEYDYLNSCLTYKDLEEESNKVAHCLINKYSIGTNSIVGVKMRRTKNFVVILLGILKTGACYVPIDPDYPESRIHYMINDCNPTIIISSSKNPQQHINSNIEISLNFILEEAKKYSCDHISLSKPESLAYIIYTSGSTGTPKGCLITHMSVMNILNHYKSEHKVSTNDSVWSITTISFDIMVLEIFLPLISGAKLLICPPCVTANPVQLVKWINKET